jgi:DNA-binding MarR family transcriptional regulator
MTHKQYLKLGLKTLREVYALERLMEEDLTISQIAFEGLSKVSLTAIIDRFEELNLAKRVPSKIDRRKTFITLTDHGRNVLLR